MVRRHERELLRETVELVRENLSETDELDLANSPPVGRYCVIGTTSVVGWRLEVWFDSYLDPSQPPRFSAWVFAPTRRSAKKIADRSEWRYAAEIGWKARSYAPSYIRSRPGASWTERGLVDSWPGWGFYFGRYVRDGLDSRATAAALARDLGQIAKWTNDSWRDYLGLAKVRVRPAQAAFKARLLAAQATCLISGCGIVQLLDAAHIVPVSRHGGYTPGNGLLLRKDLHALFDAGLLRVDQNGRVSAAGNVLEDPAYAFLRGVRVKLTRQQRESLQKRATLTGA